MHRFDLRWLAAALATIAIGCTGDKKPVNTEAGATARDIHSYSNPQQVRQTHLDLDLDVDFDKRQLRGHATLTLDRKDPAAPLILDTRDLVVSRVETAAASGDVFEQTRFTLGAADKILGAPLTIELPRDATRVRVHYITSPRATALQWLDPPQTAGKKRPFLFTQSQAIHARSWIPLQDSPGIRMTYRARIRTPQDLIALMSARQDFRLGNRKEAPTGDYTFRMPQPIPSYLIALAVGELASKEVSTRSAVWAEPSMVDRAAREFEDTERMIQAAEKLYGPYAWLRYDILVLPPSFPFGGMENPLLTFATPTVIAGDKSLVSLIAHELAHSWSGNLVTNATWSDFWLNEGFTVYVENRIQEAVYGESRARMEAVLGRQELEKELATLPPGDQILHIDLAGRDPDDGVTAVAYEKGALFLRHLEQVVGRERFDAFLLSYFQKFRFQSITTAQFRDYLEKSLPEAVSKVPVEEWLTKPGLPASAPRVTSDELDKVKVNATKADTAEWTTQHWLHFLRMQPKDADLARLDRTFGFTKSGNAEILTEWLCMAIRANYKPAEARTREFLMSVGRRKFLKPIYEELVKTPEGKRRAQSIFNEARAGYHPIAASTVAAIVN
jgi:leukotriene A-4 hydrolase/aminopeptidase